MADRPIHICILGGGFGGLYTALYLNRFPAARRGKFKITLVEQKERFLFTPLLYELITGELQTWEIAPSYHKILRSTAINFCQEKINGIDFKTRHINLENGERLTYDYLVLAVGSQNSWPNVPGLTTYGLTFRTLGDLEGLQEKLRGLESTQRECLRVAIIGGGPNGVELAAKLADRLGKRGQVRLIERGGELLKTFSRSVRVAAYRALGVRGVQIELKTSVMAIEADRLTLSRNNQPATLAVDLVVWTGGTQARDWVRRLDCSQTPEGKLLTRPTLQLVDYPEVFALGDVAEIRHSNQVVPATAQAAYQQASFAAKNILAAMTGKRLRSFRYLHLGDMLTLGKGSAIVSSFFLNLEGALASAIRRLIYIQRLPTWRHRLQVFKNLLTRLIFNKFNFDISRIKARGKRLGNFYNS